MSWITDILWSIWAGLSTAGSILFLLITGLALFGIFIGVPYLFGERRKRKAMAKALARVPHHVRELVITRSQEIGGFPPAETILAATPGLRASLSGLGVPAEELVDRMLTADVPVQEEDESLQ